MDSIDEISKNNSNKKGFFKYVFNFDEESKEEMCNIIQYAILALIPTIILNKAMQKFVPEADEEKGNVEILAEIIIQIIVMFLGIMLIQRIITYIPTYSGIKYAESNVTNIILPVLLITLSLQTKLGEKVSILVDRITELWEGEDKKSKDKKKNKSVKVSQPISQNQNQNQNLNQQMNSQTTSLAMLPPPQLISHPQTNNESANDYQSNNNLGNGFQESTPTNMYEGFAPMAANEALGGSGFGASNW
jgi:hypothetical protein